MNLKMSKVIKVLCLTLISLFSLSAVGCNSSDESVTEAVVETEVISEETSEISKEDKLDENKAPEEDSNSNDQEGPPPGMEEDSDNAGGPPPGGEGPNSQGEGVSITHTSTSSGKVELDVSFVLSDSGQSRYFDAEGNIIDPPIEGDEFYGQDAQYVDIEQAFNDNGDGTVTDLNTGLMWQQTPDYTRYTYDNAIEYANETKLGGYDDWRLPTIKELYSISDFDGELMMDGESIPYIDTMYFDFQYERMMYAGQYWSSTKYVKGGVQNIEIEGAFGFNFADGHIKSYETGYYFDGSIYDGKVPGCFVRLVRGEENVYGVNQFVDNGDGTITDTATGLMWQAMDDGQTRDWIDSLDYAENLELAGYDDWRLPSAKELQSIIDYEKTTIPAVDTNFFTISNEDSYFWSSTTQGDFKHTAVYLAFGRAYSTNADSDGVYYDWHGAGAQRSDPKTGQPEEGELASVNASDLTRIKNYVLAVRMAE